MKFKKLIFSIAIIMVIIACVNVVKAAEVSARLTPSSTSVKPGEKFTVILSATNSDGLNTINTTIQYDKNILELDNGAVADNAKWLNLGTGANVSVFANSSENIKTADLYILTFKVKEGATEGVTTISAGTITIDSFAESNSMSTIDAISTSVNVTSNGSIIGEQKVLSSIAVKTVPTKITYEAGEKFDKTGMVIEATYSDGTKKEITDYKYSPTDELSTAIKRVTITYTENGVTKTVNQNITVNGTEKDGTSNVTKDNTTAENTIAKTGLKEDLSIVIAILAIISVASYIQYKKYSDR